MAYKKKYVPKKRTFKRKPLIKKLAKRVAKLYKNVETKHWRVDGLGALPDNNPTLAIRPYPGITQGVTDYGSRIGDKITVKYLKFQSVWELGANQNSRVGRIIIFSMKHNSDGVAVAWSTIWNLYMESAYANGVNIVNGNRDWDNRKNFVTHYDQKRVFNRLGPSDTTQDHIWDVNVKIPSSCQTVQYLATSTTVTKNELFIALVADTDTGLSINYVTEFYYTDS